MAKQSDVLSVSPDELVTQDTSSTPAFLGLDDANGLWNQLGGAIGSKKGPGAGEGIIIGVIDSGIWPESKSFTDRDSKGKLIYQAISGFHGKCESVETITDGSWNANLCNKKLIAAQHFNAAWGGDTGVATQRPWEFLSPRDYNGHGTHTSSTAGGNNGVTTGPAAAFGTISGMAPRARIAMYKALWSTQDGSTAAGFTSDLVAAIDQAVADGVDVINYSVSGSQTDFLEPVQVSFLYAAAAGVFVSASAGNGGPTVSTVAHPGPWVTTVAAGTHNRRYGGGSVTLGNGVTYNGASIATAVGPASIIDSIDAGLPWVDASELALCFGTADGGAVLDPVKVFGKIVVCDRGATPRVNKSLAVKEAGGAGMILVNTTPNSLNADFHFVPTVHLQNTDSAAVKAYAAIAGATATINQSTMTYTTPAPYTASFSSRGPLIAGGGDLLKPDIVAPGQDILAAVAPPGNQGLPFALYSGTSMSAPHIAGIAALLKQLHPLWSPMMIKSALMTSAYDVLDGPNTNPLVIFRQGAGHVRPNSATDPGLVYGSGYYDWLAFLCGTTNGVSPTECNTLETFGYSLDPSDLNVASIAIGDLAGTQTVTRRVTNVGSTTATYNASYTGIAGFDVAVSPSSLTIPAGQTKSFNVTFTRTNATLDAYTGGQLTWTDGTHAVRTPIVVKPILLGAPAQVSGSGDNFSYNVQFGYNGAFTAAARGLVPATTNTANVVQNGFAFLDVTVPAGSTYARFSLFDAFTDGNDDLDLYVYLGSTPVGTSIGGTSNEEVNLVNPTEGTYTVIVHGFKTEGPDAKFTLFSWILGSAAAGNMTVAAPTSATLGGSGSIDLSFSALEPAMKYLGSVVYTGIVGLPNPTIVRIDTP